MRHIYIVDTKLLSYYLIQRGRSISDIFNKLAELLVDLKNKGDIYLCFDVGKSDFRLTEQSYYKGHRSAALAKKTIEEQLAHEKFNEDYLKLMTLFKMLGTKVVGIGGVEADDLASLIAKSFTNKSNVKVTLLTGDYDWLHMVIGTHNVRMYDFPKNDILYPKDIRAKYEVNSRRQFSVKKSIIGDKSDNIKFIRNLADIKGAQLYDQIYNKYNNPTDDEIIDEIELFIEDKPQFRLYEQHIGDGRETIREAFLSNMKIADPFMTTDNLTEQQHEELQLAAATPIQIYYNRELFMNATIQAFGYPVILTEQAKKIYGVVDG